jgi:hypothetical protein
MTTKKKRQAIPTINHNRTFCSVAAFRRAGERPARKHRGKNRHATVVQKPLKSQRGKERNGRQPGNRETHREVNVSGGGRERPGAVEGWPGRREMESRRGVLYCYGLFEASCAIRLCIGGISGFLGVFHRGRGREISHGFPPKRKSLASAFSSPVFPLPYQSLLACRF